MALFEFFPNYIDDTKDRAYQLTNSPKRELTIFAQRRDGVGQVGPSNTGYIAIVSPTGASTREKDTHF